MKQEEEGEDISKKVSKTKTNKKQTNKKAKTKKKKGFFF
jgi:hypothetical protein